MKENSEKLIEEWLKKAEHDLGSAELTLNNKPEYTDTICFHCQQAVEKYLKAYLIYLNIEFEKTHNLIYLLDLLNEKEKIDDKLYEMAEKLESYAVEIRYPDETIEPSLEEAKESLVIAKEIKNIILNKLIRQK